MFNPAQSLETSSLPPLGVRVESSGPGAGGEGSVFEGSVYGRQPLLELNELAIPSLAEVVPHFPGWHSYVQRIKPSRCQSKIALAVEKVSHAATLDQFLAGMAEIPTFQLLEHGRPEQRCADYALGKFLSERDFRPVTRDLRPSSPLVSHTGTFLEKFGFHAVESPEKGDLAVFGEYYPTGFRITKQRIGGFPHEVVTANPPSQSKNPPGFQALHFGIVAAVSDVNTQQSVIDSKLCAGPVYRHELAMLPNFLGDHFLFFSKRG
ncbi:MAG: hypothetical protein KDD70_08535 [Bdellovibrionales bacterium]|nr:hypothetical protein [Bdellovibrionales bacterium]